MSIPIKMEPVDLDTNRVEPLRNHIGHMIHMGLEKARCVDCHCYIVSNDEYDNKIAPLQDKGIRLH